MKRLLFLLILLTACVPQITSVQINDINIPVELAVTLDEQIKGLMFRTNLTGGMLFVYNEEKQRNFWMKNTLIPLDIIFIGKNLEITTIHNANPCKEDPCKIYSGDAKYILEVNKNFTIENNINEGMKVKLYK